MVDCSSNCRRLFVDFSSTFRRLFVDVSSTFRRRFIDFPSTFRQSPTDTLSTQNYRKQPKQPNSEDQSDEQGFHDRAANIGLWSESAFSPQHMLKVWLVCAPASIKHAFMHLCAFMCAFILHMCMCMHSHTRTEQKARGSRT